MENEQKRWRDIEEEIDAEEEQFLEQERAMTAGAGASSGAIEAEPWYDYDDDSLTITAPTRKGLEEKGRSIVQDYIARYDLRLTSEAFREIDAIIRKGVAQIFDKGDGNNNEKIYEAETNLTKFMESLAYETQNNNLAEIEKSTIRNLNSRFCPVYPFDEFF